MEIDISRLLKTLMKRSWIVIIVALLFGIGAREYTDRYVTPVYTASVSMFIQNTINNDGNISSGDLNSSQALAGTLSVLLESNRVMEKVVQNLDDTEMSPSRLASMVSTSVVDATGILNIYVQSTDPYLAQKAANTIGYVAPQELMKFLKAGSIELLDQAALPFYPSYPDVRQNTILAAVTGFVVASILVMLIELFDTRIKSENDIKQITDIYVIGVIPIIRQKNQRRITPLLRRKSIGDKLGIDFTSLLVNEAYRTARTNLLFLLSTKSYKKIIVTSAVPSEGKSTICVNLAISFAKANKKVLLIDGDMRNPGIHKAFKLSLKCGLSDVLIGFTDLTSSIKQSTIENLSIITAGTIPPNPADLLILPSFQVMMEAITEKFDFIFLDTPPVNLYTDALSVANNMDGTILIAKYNWTKRENLKQTIAKFDKIDAKIFGIILNSFDDKKYFKQISYGKYGNYISATR